MTPTAGDAPAGGDATAWAVVRAVAAYGLPGAPPIPPIGDDQLLWRRIVGLAEQQRVLGLLAAAVGVGPGWLRPTKPGVPTTFAWSGRWDAPPTPSSEPRSPTWSRRDRHWPTGSIPTPASASLPTWT